MIKQGFIAAGWRMFATWVCVFDSALFTVCDVSFIILHDCSSLLPTGQINSKQQNTIF